MAIPNVVVSAPSQLFTLPDSFAAIAGGSIYIGRIDSDPTLTTNQIQVYIQNSDGSTTAVSQPITINAGGYPEYNGAVAKFVTVEGQSMAILDANGVRQFYYPNVLKYDPDLLRSQLSSQEGATLAGYKGARTGTIVETVADKLNGGMYSIIDFGGVTNTDCTVAFQKAITSACGCLYIPPGVWGYTGTLAFGGMRIIGSGPYVSTLKALSADAIVKIDSGANWSGVYIFGNGTGVATAIGQYGLLISGGQSILVENVHVRYFGKYGVILDRTQNSALIKINSQYNAVGFLYNNGARNITHVMCNAALDINPTTGIIAGNRNILMTNISDDPNFSNTSIGQGNSNLVFLGGIYEYGDYADNNMEIAHAGDGIIFVGCEFTESLSTGYLINANAGISRFIKCDLNGLDTAPNTHVGSGASVEFEQGGVGASGRGKLAPHNGVVVDAGGRITYTGRLGNFYGTPPSFHVSGSATVVYDSANCWTTLTLNSTGAGVYNPISTSSNILAQGVKCTFEFELVSLSAPVQVTIHNQVVATITTAGYFRFSRTCTGTETSSVVGFRSPSGAVTLVINGLSTIIT